MLYHPPTGSTDPNAPYVGKNVAAGTLGSKVPPGAAEYPQRELVNLIMLSGQSPTDGDLTQVTRAIRGGQLDFDATDTGTADAVLCQIGLPHTQIAAGLPFTFIKGPNANTGNAVPTLTITDLQGNNGLTGTIVKSGGGALAKGDLPGGALITVRARAPGVFAVVSMVTISDVLAIIAANKIGLQNPLAPVSTPGTYIYTPSSPGVRAILVKGQAPGGGGSASYTTTSSQVSAGIPGSGGGYFEHFVILTAGYTATYVVGAQGLGGSNGGSAGTNGGSTSFGGGPVAQGGLGGPSTGGPAATGSQSNTAAVSGGAASGGNLVNRQGGPSQASQFLGNTAYGGQSGASQNGSPALGYATTAAGVTGAGYGSGGGGGVTLPNANAQIGANGAPGFIQITEIF